MFNLDLTDFIKGRFVWSGWNRGDGYEATAFGTVTDADGREEIWRGDSNGYVYRMDGKKQHKDEVGGGDDEDIISLIHLPPFRPSGLSIVKRFLDCTVSLYQRVSGSTTLSWIVDSSYLSPSTDITVEIDGHAPFWNDGSDTDYTQEWDTTVWVSRPMIPIIVDVKEAGKFIEFIIENLGANSRDAIAYHGMEVAYQILGRKR